MESTSIPPTSAMQHGSSSHDCCRHRVSADAAQQRTFAPYSTPSSTYCDGAANGVYFPGSFRCGAPFIITPGHGRMRACGSVLQRTIYKRLRKQAGRSACPSVAIMVGQSVKTTERGGISGFDAHRRVKGVDCPRPRTRRGQIRALAGFAEANRPLTTGSRGRTAAWNCRVFLRSRRPTYGC